jgi:hypothetical protein
MVKQNGYRNTHIYMYIYIPPGCEYPCVARGFPLSFCAQVHGFKRFRVFTEASSIYIYYDTCAWTPNNFHGFSLISSTGNPGFQAIGSWARQD